MYKLYGISKIYKKKHYGGTNKTQCTLKNVSSRCQTSDKPISDIIKKKCEMMTHQNIKNIVTIYHME